MKIHWYKWAMKYYRVIELADAMPEGLSRADSTDFADKYIRRWICDVLLYRMAQKNIPDIERIDSIG